MIWILKPYIDNDFVFVVFLVVAVVVVLIPYCIFTFKFRISGRLFIDYGDDSVDIDFAAFHTAIIYSGTPRNQKGACACLAS